MRRHTRPLAPLLLAALAVPLGIAFTVTPAYAQGMPGGGGMEGGGPGGEGGGGPGAGGPGGGGKPRPPITVKRKTFDKVIAGMFRKADADRDGRVGMAELHAVLDARREAAILARFKSVDGNGDGAVSLAEFSAWQTSLGSVAAHDDAAGGDLSTLVHDAIEPDGRDAGDKDLGFLLADLIEPLTGTALALADSDHDGQVTLDEFTAYEGKRFAAADKNGDGELSMGELRPRDEKRSGRGPGGPGTPGGPTGPGGMAGPPPCPPGQTC